MSVKRNGSQRNVYLPNHEWKEFDAMAKLEGFKGRSDFIIYIIRQFVAGNIVFKQKYNNDCEP